MTRRALAIIVLLFVRPAYLSAQHAEFRVESASASVHKAPSIGSPVIGQAPRGLALEVTRDLGSWVRIPWPDAPDAIGYIHVSAGTRIGAAMPRIGGGAALTAEPAEAIAAGSRSVALQPSYVIPAHVVGLGGQLGGSTIGVGINARTWFHDRWGLQLEVARTSPTGTIASDRLTATQFAPSLVYSISNLMTDYVWVRPYLGAGPRLVHRTLEVGSPASGVAVSQNSVGLQTFGGAEFTFASVPRLSLSADLRYGWIDDTHPAFELDGVGFSLAAHWYLK
jgi:hypothetical protein